MGLARSGSNRFWSAVQAGFWVVAGLVGVWLLACGDGDGTVTPDPPNQAPQPVGSVPAQLLVEGDTVTLDIASYFRDPDGDQLTFTAATTDAGVASVSVAGTLVTIRAVAAGMATVTVTAWDLGGLTASTAGRGGGRSRRISRRVGVGSIAGREMGVGQYAAIDVSSHSSPTRMVTRWCTRSESSDVPRLHWRRLRGRSS